MHKSVLILKTLAQLHECAKNFAKESAAVETAQAELESAYITWKHQNRITDFVERGTPTWKQMMLGTEVYYRNLLNAKARKRRAEKKLIAAVGV